MADKVNVTEAIHRATANQPTWFGRINDSLNVFALKAEGKFSDWHKHDDTDDVFFVLSGKLTIELRDRNIELGPGEMYVIPTGVEHCPRAEEASRVVLISGGRPPPGWSRTR